jgi:SAM-dependent methyltransferase
MTETPETEIAMNWFEDESFWIDLCPFLFPETRHAGAPAEVESILQLTARPVRAALDLGCGPGRHAIALAKRGIKVTGVDITPYYLETAEAAAEAHKVQVEWVREDMRRFARPNSYDLAIIMFSTLGFFEDEEDDRRVLGNVYESLAQGGTFVLELAGKEWVAEHYEDTSCDDLPDGSVLFQRHRVIDDWTRIHNEWTLVKGESARTFAFDMRVYSGTELRDRLTQCGFRSVRLFGDLEGGELTYGAKRLVAAAVK